MQQKSVDELLRLHDNPPLEVNLNIRVGTDIVDIDRIKRSIENVSFLKKVYSANEVTDAQAKTNPAASFAARFAAKEAFFKALGTGLYSQGMGPQDVWIENEPNGRPLLKLSPAAAILLNNLGAQWSIDVSLAHDGNYATATVVILVP